VTPDKTENWPLKQLRVPHLNNDTPYFITAYLYANNKPQQQTEIWHNSVMIAVTVQYTLCLKKVPIYMIYDTLYGSRPITIYN